jgi:hypothetical protein
MTSYKWIGDTFLNGETPVVGETFKDGIGNNGVRDRMLTSIYPMDALRFASGPTLLKCEAWLGPGTPDVPYFSLDTRTIKVESIENGSDILMQWGRWCVLQVEARLSRDTVLNLWAPLRTPLYAAKFAAWGACRALADSPLAFSAMKRLQRDKLLELVEA